MKNNIQSKQVFIEKFLSEKGLNIHAIFDLDKLPDSFLQTLHKCGVDTHKFNQLIVLGHLGKTLWENVEAGDAGSENPIDDFSASMVEQFFARIYPDNHYATIYPGSQVIGLQQLGILAGWHHASPFKVGINDKWGSWFAYRAVVLSDTSFTPTHTLESVSPCISCKEQPCVSACPANALDKGELNFSACINYRKQELSGCKSTCFARVRCPVGAEFRYSDEQIHYHYGVSMKTIEAFY